MGADAKHTVLPLAQQCLSCTAKELGHEFQRIANLRSRTTQPVRHFSIAFAPEDGTIDDDIKAEIAVRIMDEMGYGDSQYFTVAHDRENPDHRQPHKHDHIHIVANAIKTNGGKVSHFWDYRNLERCLREIETDYGLRQLRNSWERSKDTAIVDASELQSKIDEALLDSPSLKEWINRLEASKVNLKFKLTKCGNIQGISYINDGQVVRGGDIDRSWGKMRLSFAPTPENLALAQSSNLKVQSLSIDLRQHDRELLAKAADLAMEKLGGFSEFKSRNLKISLSDGVLKVQRLHPNRWMFSAKKDVNQEWKTIGIPNINAKTDVEILEYTMT